MRIGMRLLLGYFVIVAVAAWFVLAIFVQEIKPGVRRATEGSLNDTATLLAQIAREDLLAGRPRDGQLARAFEQLNRYPVNADISGIKKTRNEYRVYLTDAQGRVVFDSSGEALGEDYSRWNDVWLTLRGQYGARSSPLHPDQPESTVMYVAAPVRHEGHIIGVLSVGKPNIALAPVIRRSERRIMLAGVALLGIALLAGVLMVLWINRSIGTLVRYADSVTEAAPLPLPKPGSSELRKLAQALENMRIRLEGKNYIESYVHALTHELKSPLAGIRGAAEILREGPPPQVAARFSDNILRQNARMQALVEKLLAQAKLENRLEITLAPVSLTMLFATLEELYASQLAHKSIALRSEPVRLEALCAMGDETLLLQALGNLIANAIDFTPAGGEIALAAWREDTQIVIRVTDTGCGIPDYALTRIFDRFYSLPRENGQKSSGLGLAFVQEVARLHQGEIALRNRPEGGVEARMTVKAA